MTAYPDTSFLCALYIYQSHSLKASTYFQSMKEPLHVSALLLFEFRQSTRLQGYLHSRNRDKGFHRSKGTKALAQLEENIDAGALVVEPVDFADILNISENLSSRHTLKQGCRSFDILHVATALHFGARHFLSFDTHQLRLAKAEGLLTPLDEQGPGFRGSRP